MPRFHRSQTGDSIECAATLRLCDSSTDRMLPPADPEIPLRRGAPEFLRDWGVRTASHLESRWAEVAGWRIHSRSTRAAAAAEDVPFILLHGLVISSLYMLPLAESLAARGHAVHAPDMPGFGRSSKGQRVPDVPGMARVLSRWLEAEGIPRCHLVANSLGCQVVADWAVQFPRQVCTVTLIGPTIDPASHDILRMAGLILWDGLREPATLLLDHLIDQERAGVGRSVQMIGHMLRDRIETKLPRIAAPGLVLHGEYDPVAPARWAREAAALMPHGEWGTIANGWHCAHYSHPEEVAARILAFTARATAATPTDVRT